MKTTKVKSTKTQAYKLHRNHVFHFTNSQKTRKGRLWGAEVFILYIETENIIPGHGTWLVLIMYLTIAFECMYTKLLCNATVFEPLKGYDWVFLLWWSKGWQQFYVVPLPLKMQWILMLLSNIHCDQYCRPKS